MRRILFILLTLAALFGAACAKTPDPGPAAPPSSEQIAKLMDRLEEAANARDFAAMRKIYASDAEVEIRFGREEPRRVAAKEYLDTAERNASKFDAYSYAIEGQQVETDGEDARVSQTVVETATAGGMALRSKTEAVFTLRLVGGKPRIVKMTGNTIVARPGEPQAEKSV
ncbi:DUF4440 domain-containing protein [bacterium]|nr:DUF4440 domain-containing protein [bacterium]